MSVLKCKRSESKTEFIRVANEIYTGTLQFLSRLSARYSRLIAGNTMQTAHNILQYSMMANSMRPTDEIRYGERTKLLLLARAATEALDSQLCHVYEVLMMNPEGAFANGKGNSVPASEAVKKLDYMAENLGCKIDEEVRLLTGVLKADKKAFKKS